jgi:hypothetical protein
VRVVFVADAWREGVGLLGQISRDCVQRFGLGRGGCWMAVSGGGASCRSMFVVRPGGEVALGPARSALIGCAAWPRRSENRE